MIAEGTKLKPEVREINWYTILHGFIACATGLDFL